MMMMMMTMFFFASRIRLGRSNKTVPRWVSARWVWPCLRTADVRPSTNPPTASHVQTVRGPLCWNSPVMLKRPGSESYRPMGFFLYFLSESIELVLLVFKMGVFQTNLLRATYIAALRSRTGRKSWLWRWECA